MRKRISAVLIAGLAVVAIGATASVSTAKHGADDPAGHVRHGNGADNPAGHVRHGHKRHRHGADDRPGHVRHGHGADDGPNHR